MGIEVDPGKKAKEQVGVYKLQLAGRWCWWVFVQKNSRAEL